MLRGKIWNSWRTIKFINIHRFLVPESRIVYFLCAVLLRNVFNVSFMGRFRSRFILSETSPFLRWVLVRAFFIAAFDPWNIYFHMREIARAFIVLRFLIKHSPWFCEFRVRVLQVRRWISHELILWLLFYLLLLLSMGESLQESQVFLRCQLRFLFVCQFLNFDWFLFLFSFVGWVLGRVLSLFIVFIGSLSLLVFDKLRLILFVHSALIPHGLYVGFEEGLSWVWHH